MVSVEGTDATFHFAYDHPTGLITYDRSGWMTVQIDIKGVRKPFLAGAASGADGEKVAARIFRVGILMQGQPPKISEIIRWAWAK